MAEDGWRDERLLGGRTVVLGGEIDDVTADRVCAQLRMLAADDPTAGITLSLSSPGGSVPAAMAILDTMHGIEPDVSTVVTDVAFGVAGVLLAAGVRGGRSALPHARVLVRAPRYGPDGGTATDPVARAEFLDRVRGQLVEITAGLVGQTAERVHVDLVAGRCFDAHEALAYGFVDRVVEAIPAPRVPAGGPRARRGAVGPGKPARPSVAVGAYTPRRRRPPWRHPVPWVIAGWLLSALSSVATLALFAWGLLLLCRRRLRAADARPSARRDLRHHLAAAGRLYLLPIAVALTLWVALLASISWSVYRPDVASLVALERTLRDVSAFFSSTIKLNEPAVLGGLVAVYLLTVLLLARPGARPADASTRRHRLAAALWSWTDRYTRYSGPAAAGLATLAAISVLGTVTAPAEAAALRIRTAQADFAAIATRVEAALTVRVTSEVYAGILAALPPTLGAATGLTATLDAEADGLRRHADAVWADKHVDVPALDADLRRHVDRIAAVQRLDTVLVTGAPRTDPVPARVSESGLATARAELDAHPDNGILVLDEGRKKVYLQIEKIFSERVVALTKPLTEAVPLLDPLLQTLVEALDSTLQSRIAASYDRAMATAVDHPEQLAEVIDAEADGIARQTRVEPLVARHAEALESVRADLERQRVDLVDGRSTLDRAAADVPSGRAPGGRVRTPVPDPFPPFNAVPARPPSLHVPGVPDVPAPEVPGVPRAPGVRVPVPEVPHVPRIPRIPIFF